MLSDIAEIYIENNYDYVIKSVEKLDHDGYDSYGPQSDIWTLYVFYEVRGEYFVDYLSWENWFLDNTKEEYTLVKKYNFREVIEGGGRTICEKNIITMFGRFYNSQRVSPKLPFSLI